MGGRGGGAIEYSCQRVFYCTSETEGGLWKNNAHGPFSELAPLLPSPLMSAWTDTVNFPTDACPERRHGSTRVQGHAFLAWRSSWRMVVYIYFITAAENAIVAPSWAAPVRATGSVQKSKAAGPVHHLQNHTCWVTLTQPARRAAVKGQPSSLQPHWAYLHCYENSKHIFPKSQ